MCVYVCLFSHATAYICSRQLYVEHEAWKSWIRSPVLFAILYFSIYLSFPVNVCYHNLPPSPQHRYSLSSFSWRLLFYFLHFSRTFTNFKLKNIHVYKRICTLKTICVYVYIKEIYVRKKLTYVLLINISNSSDMFLICNLTYMKREIMFYKITTDEELTIDNMALTVKNEINIISFLAAVWQVLRRRNKRLWMEFKILKERQLVICYLFVSN